VRYLRIAGAGGIMSKYLKVAPGSRPVIVPEFFSGKGSYEDWIDHCGD